MDRITIERKTREIADLLVRKNTAYGDSVDSTFQEYGLMAYVIRLDDKLNRLKNLIANKDIDALDESIEDTLKDTAGYAILALAQLEDEKMKQNAMVRYAQDELNVLLEQAKAEGEDSYQMQKAFNDNVLDVIKAFCTGGHSGFTASMAIQVIDRLLKYRPLTHLTLEDDEWCEVSKGVYQNKRASNVFKEEGKFDGKPYCIDGPDGKPCTLEDYPKAYWGVFENDVPKEEEIRDGITEGND